MNSADSQFVSDVSDLVIGGFTSHLATMPPPPITTARQMELVAPVLGWYQQRIHALLAESKRRTFKKQSISYDA